MDTNENGVAIRVRDRNPRRQGDKDIALPGHDDAIAIGRKNAFESPRDVKRHLLFWDLLAGNTTAVETAVAGIDHHNRGRAAALRITACLCRGGSAAGQDHNRQTGNK